MQRTTSYLNLFPNDVQNVIGTQVLDVAGLSVGHVQAVYLDNTQAKIRFLEVQGLEVRLVPVEVLSSVQAETLCLAIPASRVLTAPSVPPGADLPAWADLYRHYDLVPHWEDGNIFPGYGFNAD